MILSVKRKYNKIRTWDVKRDTTNIFLKIKFTNAREINAPAWCDVAGRLL